MEWGCKGRRIKRVNSPHNDAHRALLADPSAAEWQLDALFRNDAVGIFILSLENRYLRVNPRWCSMLGYAEEELLGTDLATVTHPEDLEATALTGDRMFEGDTNSYRMEKRYLRKDGSWFAAEVTMEALRDGSGQLQGAIAVRSSPGEGTCFTVLLPAGVKAATAEPLSQGHATPAPPARRPAVVLVADDDDVVRRNARTALEMAGHTTLMAEDGLGAIDAFRQHQRDVDVLLLDMMMPGLGGDEVCATARRLRPGVPVILCSGYDEGVMETSAALDSADGVTFLHKPYSLWPNSPNAWTAASRVRARRLRGRVASPARASRRAPTPRR